MPLISIIIPCHNAEKYLNSCLNSVTNQTYSNIEIICVEDHSIDGTWKLLKDWAKKDKRIKLYQLKKNYGVSCARNLGLKIAKGEYINFVDSDDLVSINGLEDMYHLLKAYNSPIVGEEVTEIEEDEMQNNPLVTSEFKWFGSLDIKDDPDQINDITVTVWAKLYKRDAIKDYFIENCIWEDYDFSIKTAVKNSKIIIGINESKNKAGYYYRYNPNGISKRLQIPGPKNLDAIKITQSILQGLKHYYQNNPILKAAIYDRIRVFLHSNLGKIYNSCYLTAEQQLEIGSLLQTIYQYHFPQLYYQESLSDELLDAFTIIQSLMNSVILSKDLTTDYNNLKQLLLPHTHIERHEYLEAKRQFLTRAKELEIEKNS